MSQLTLKIVAVISMLIDHIGVVFFPEMTIFRLIGRLSFPIFCFLLVEGALFTSDWKKYAFRLLLTGVISEPLFDLCFYGTLFYPEHQNVLFTLCFGLLMITGMEQIRNRQVKVLRKGKELSSLFILLTLAFFCFLAEILKTDYQFQGILLIFVFYTCYNQQQKKLEPGMIYLFYPLVVILFLTRTRFDIFTRFGDIRGFFQFYVQDFSVFALFLFENYKGKTITPKKPPVSYASRLFYLVYPFSLLAIYVVSVAF